MERFARSPEILSTFAVHKDTRDPLPPSVLEQEILRQRISSQLEKQSQLMLALLDQMYHSNACIDPHFSSTDILSRLQNRIDVFPYHPPTTQQAQFKHLDSYGAGYYAYFYSRYFSDHIWDKCFRNGQDLSRESGEKYKKEVLEWGGARDGWTCMKAILGEDILETVKLSC
jgi:intermediate peptidase